MGPRHGSLLNLALEAVGWGASGDSQSAGFSVYVGGAPCGAQILISQGFRGSPGPLLIHF